MGSLAISRLRYKASTTDRILHSVHLKHWVWPILFISFLCCTGGTDSLFRKGEGPPVRSYDRVDYQDERCHHLLKRSIRNNSRLTFISHGRTFRLNFTKDDVFHPGIIVENSDGNFLDSLSLPVVGNLEGDKNSHVRGILLPDGTFEGYLSTGDGLEFYVEPTTRYSNDPMMAGHSFMYRSNDIIKPSETPSCASHHLHQNRKKNDSETVESEFHSKKSFPHRRRKRWVVDAKKKTCMLFLQADYAFFSRFGSEEAAINVMTNHIQKLNEIYRQMDFNMDGAPDDIQFMIKRVKVHTKNRTVDPSYPFDGHFEVIKFLEVFSEGDYDSFCLAYLFTYRDFEGGTLGLAWTGDLKNAGGVCEKKGHFRGGIKSLNTGIITLLNYGKLVSPAVSHVTLAHEIGHNFGSPHDPENDRSCTPGGDDGNFIMFARATAGDRRNNKKFSSCSLKSINPVLTVKARDTYGCFQEPQNSICGNGVVEEGEECDCGWEEDCKESCCYPMQRTSWLGPSGTPCRLKPSAECSPSKGPCCTDQCRFTLGNKCRDDNGCRNTAYCDGRQAECPSSILKPNKTICDLNSHVCFMGECTGSICLAYGLESCQCSQETFDRSTKLCEVCCRIPGENQCISSFDWNEYPYDMPSVLAKAGTPCRNYTGYCDSYHSCREVDPSGPLATLRKLLSADEGLATIAEWVDHHWYVIIGVLVLFFAIMGVALRVSRKKRLRKLTVLHSNVEAIQIQRTYLEDVQTGQAIQYPTAVRKKIPFKKKVRERRSKIKHPKPKLRKPGFVPDSEKSRSVLWSKSAKESPSNNNIKGVESGDIGASDLPGPSSSTQPIASSSLPPILTNHETKRAIVPNANSKRSGVKGRGVKKLRKIPSTNNTKPTIKQGKGPNSKSTGKLQSSTTTNGEKSPRKKSATGPKHHTRKNIQVVYRPPFSVKVEFVPDEPNSKLKQSPSSSSNPTPKSVKPDKNPSIPSKSTPVLKSSKSTTNPKSTNFLRRNPKSLALNTKSRDPKSELQILIPKSPQDEEESATPQPFNTLF